MTMSCWLEVTALSGILSDILHLIPSIALAIAIALLCGETVRTIRKRQANRIRNRKHALEEMENMPDTHFKRMFRMSRFAFNRLVGIVDDKSKKTNSVKAENSSGSEVSIVTKVACALRWLAGGSYIDICFAFRVAPGSFYHEDGILWGTLKIIDECFTIGFSFDDMHELRRLSAGFSLFSYRRLIECVFGDRRVGGPNSPTYE